MASTGLSIGESIDSLTCVLRLNARVGKNLNIQSRLICPATPFHRIEFDPLNAVYILTVTLKLLNRVERKCTEWIRTWNCCALTRFHRSTGCIL